MPGWARSANSGRQAGRGAAARRVVRHRGQDSAANRTASSCAAARCGTARRPAAPPPPRSHRGIHPIEDGHAVLVRQVRPGAAHPVQHGRPHRRHAPQCLAPARARRAADPAGSRRCPPVHRPGRNGPPADRGTCVPGSPGPHAAAACWRGEPPRNSPTSSAAAATGSAPPTSGSPGARGGARPGCAARRSPSSRAVRRLLHRTGTGTRSVPVRQTLTALARALRLNADERDHLFHLAGRGAAALTDGPRPRAPGALLVLDRLSTRPPRSSPTRDVLVRTPWPPPPARPRPARPPRRRLRPPLFTDPAARRDLPARGPRHAGPHACRAPARAARRPPARAGGARRSS